MTLATAGDSLTGALVDVVGDAKVALLHSSLVELCEPRSTDGPGPSSGIDRWATLRALRALVDRGVTLALPTFTFRYCHDRVYSHRESASESGLLGVWAMDLVGARRTPHPIYSFTVVGPLADRLAGCANTTAWGDDSIFAEAERLDGVVVMMGSKWSYCTFFHRLEESARVAYRSPKEFPGTADYGAGVQPANPIMWVRDLACEVDNDWTGLVDGLRASGAIREARFQRGSIQAAPCRTIMEVGGAMLRANSLAMARDPVRTAYGADARQRKAASPPYKIAILGSANVHLIVEATLASSRRVVLDREIDVRSAPFGQAEQWMQDSSSPLRSSPPDLSICVDRLEDLMGVHGLDDVEPALIEERVHGYAERILAFHLAVGATTLVHEFADADPRVLSLADVRTAAGVAHTVARCNAILAEVLGDAGAMHILPTAQWLARAGTLAYDDRLWALGRFPYGRDFSNFLGDQYAGALLATAGRAVRLLVVDLDNTLWGGVLGEDGFGGIQVAGDHPGNAFLDFQRALRGLSKRGIALAIASKNDPEPALDVITRHPGMALRREDFVAMRIGWDPKPGSVVAICEELNLGLEQVMFVDDSPVERELMRQRLPQVKVLELPEDPTAYARCLLASPFVACLALTDEDRRRTELYRARGAAETARAQLGGDGREFQRSLGVTIHLQPLDESNVERAAQLMAKTNQFNTTTRRYSAAQLRQLAARGDLVIVIGAEDRFVPRENIGVLVLRLASPTMDAAAIDDYLLSCRALGKGIETAVLYWLSDRLRRRGWRCLIGHVIETERNTPVRRVFEEAAFENGQEPGMWRKNLADGTGALDPTATVTFADAVADSHFPTSHP